MTFGTNFNRSGGAFTNGYILNGVAHFTQATNPTVRNGGGALVVGDKLYRTDLRVDAVWTGTFWLRASQIFGSGTTATNFTVVNSATRITYPVNAAGRFFAHSLTWRYARTTGVIDASNYYTVDFRPARNDGTPYLVGGVLATHNTITDASDNEGTAVLNQVIPVVAGIPNIGIVATVVAVVGTPGALRYDFFATISEIIT